MAWVVSAFYWGRPRLYQRPDNWLESTGRIPSVDASPLFLVVFIALVVFMAYWFGLPSEACVLSLMPSLFAGGPSLSQNTILTALADLLGVIPGITFGKISSSAVCAQKLLAHVQNSDISKGSG